MGKGWSGLSKAGKPLSGSAALFGLVLCCSVQVIEANMASSDSTRSGRSVVSPEDDWPDLSDFLDSKFGFLPMVIPITEPAVGYGAAGALAFVDKPLGGGAAGFGRPNITMVGGLATENGTWGVFAGDLRHWKGDRLQTLAGILYASANLDFYGIRDDALLDSGLRYNLEPKGFLARAKYRLGATSLCWAGLGYTFSVTDVAFDAPESTLGIPDHAQRSNLGGITPSFTYDSRDNFFTPLRGTYVDVTARFFGPAVGGDDAFQNVSLLVMQYVPLGPAFFLGVRGDAKASFGDAPFYMLPFISLRGAPILRYQGGAVAHGEVELRWQCWRRFSLVGFGGRGAAWNDFEHLDGKRTITTGGGGFRYELARRYGIHAGLDVAFGPDETAIYVQVGSAWARP
jgi:surface antigen Omp85-like protein